MRSRLLSIMSIFIFAAFPVISQENQGNNQQNQTDRQGQDQQSQEEQGPAYSNTVPSGVDGHVILDNLSTVGWKIIESGGEGVYAKPAMSRVYFDIGGEYYIDLSNLDPAQFPVDIRSGGGEVIISQRDIETPDIEGANISVSDDGIRFTMNENLAGRVSMFRAAPYPQMVGFISPVSAEAAESGQSGSGEGQGDTEGGGQGEAGGGQG